MSFHECPQHGGKAWVGIGLAIATYIPGYIPWCTGSWFCQGQGNCFFLVQLTSEIKNSNKTVVNRVVSWFHPFTINEDKQRTVGQIYTYPKAWSRSWMRSSTSSMPTLSRINRIGQTHFHPFFSRYGSMGHGGRVANERLYPTNDSARENNRCLLIPFWRLLHYRRANQMRSWLQTCASAFWPPRGWGGC